MNVVSSSADGASRDPEGISQTMSAVDSLVGGEVGGSTLDTGTSVVDGMVNSLAEAGLSEGVGDKMASAMGAMLDQGETQSAAAAASDTASLYAPPSPPTAAPGTTENATTSAMPPPSPPETVAQRAKREAAQRASQLVNSTAGLSSQLGNGLIAGEAPSEVRSPKLSMSASKEDPCDLDAATSNQNAPPLESGVSGSFALPPGSLCRETTTATDRRYRRLAPHGPVRVAQTGRRMARRRKLQAGETAGCPTGSTGAPATRASRSVSPSSEPIPRAPSPTRRPRQPCLTFGCASAAARRKSRTLPSP